MPVLFCRLLESHKKLQKVNHNLEDKLLKVVSSLFHMYKKVLESIVGCSSVGDRDRQFCVHQIFGSREAKSRRGLMESHARRCHHCGRPLPPNQTQGSPPQSKECPTSDPRPFTLTPWAQTRYESVTAGPLLKSSLQCVNNDGKNTHLALLLSAAGKQV